MESRDLVSVSRPIFASFGLEDFRSRDLEYCKEMVCRKFYNLTIFFVTFSSKKQLKHVGKMPKIWKKFNESGNGVFNKNFGKMHKFLKSRSFWWSKVSVSVSSRNFISVSKVTVSTTSLKKTLEIIRTPSFTRFSRRSGLAEVYCIQGCHAVLNFKIGFQDLEKVLKLAKIYI